MPEEKIQKERQEEEPMATSRNKPLDSYYAMSPELSSLQASISNKASPALLKSWITMVLTLDGRDKVTKAIQYASRLLAHYYNTKGKAHRNTQALTAATYFLSKARRWRNLQVSLAKSRKAYRFGRSVIEFEKLSKIGFGHWVAWHLRQIVFQTTIADNVHVGDLLFKGKQSQAADDKSQHERNNAETIEHAVLFHKQESSITWHKDTKIDTDERNLHLQNDELSMYPPPMHLPRRISSNLGTATTILSKRQGSPKNYRQLSSLWHFVYMSLSSCIDEEKAKKHCPAIMDCDFQRCKVIGSGRVLGCR